MNLRAVLILTVVLFVSSTVAKAQVVFFEGTYAEAVDKAKTENKLLFIDFRADWCKPCVEMEQTTFQNVEVGDFINAKYIALKVDVDYFDGMDVRDKFNVSTYPSMLLVEANSETVNLRMLGFKPAHLLMNELKDFDSVYGGDVIETSESDPPPTTEKKPKKKCFIGKWFRS